jgi:hypothetical protein
VDIYYLVTFEGISGNLGQTSLPRQHFSDVPTEPFAPLQHAVIAERFICCV